MTKEEIMQMVQESLLDATAPFSRPKDPLSMKEFCLSFAERIAAAEREACAKLCDEKTNPNADKFEPVSQYESGCYITAEYLAAAIRARGAQ